MSIHRLALCTLVVCCAALAGCVCSPPGPSCSVGGYPAGAGCPPVVGCPTSGGIMPPPRQFSSRMYPFYRPDGSGALIGEGELRQRMAPTP